MKFKTKFVMAAVLGAMALSSCQSGYSSKIPLLMNAGFSKKKLDDHVYKVTYTGNAFTQEQRVWNYWLNRCAELTKENGYEVFALLKKADWQAYKAENAEKAAALKGSDYYMIPRIELPGNAEVQPIYYTYSHSYYESKGYIFMYNAPLPDDALGEFHLDADTILAELKPFIDAKGKVAPPNRQLLLMKAMIEGGMKTGQFKNKDDAKDAIEAGDSNTDI